MTSQSDDSKKHGTRLSSGTIVKRDELDAALSNVVKDFENSLTEALAEFKKKVLSDLSSKINSLIKRVEVVEENSSKALELAQINEDRILAISDKLIHVGQTNSRLVSDLKVANETILSLEEQLEDRTNRQLRKTLVISNVPEQDNENWEKTKEILAGTIERASEKLKDEEKINKEEALSMLERVHRGREKKGRKGPRQIFAAINDWRNSEKIKAVFMKARINIFCEQKYGPRTNWRRGKALAQRKELKDKGEIVKGYVAFPARLMVVKTGQHDYVKHYDFSKMPVDFSK